MLSRVCETPLLCVRQIWLRFAAREHPDKVSSTTSPDAFVEAEQASQVMLDRHKRLSYFKGDRVIQEEEEEEIVAITGLTPHRCTQPYLEIVAGGRCTVEWTTSNAAARGIHTYRLESLQHTHKATSNQEWKLEFEGPTPHATLTAIGEHTLVRGCAINRFGAGEWSIPVSLHMQKRADNARISSAGGSRQAGPAGEPAPTPKQLINRRKRADARERLMICMSTMGRLNMHAREELEDALSRYERLHRDGGDMELVQRARALHVSLQKRIVADKDIARWRRELKYTVADTELI